MLLPKLQDEPPGSSLHRMYPRLDACVTTLVETTSCPAWYTLINATLGFA